MKENIPLVFNTSEMSPIAFYNGHFIIQKTFLFHVEQTRTLLEKKKYCINLCENRYHFLVVFSACTSLQQISLLPGSRAEKEIERLDKSYKDNYIVDDRIIETICLEENIDDEFVANSILINNEQVVAIVFTSGSTGIPKANLKTWGQLSKSALRVKDRLFNEMFQYSLLATVPPQHMFGFETTIIYPLMLGVVIHAGRPFYVLDIKKALSEIKSPRVLITTPIHLKACNSEKKEWPDIDFVISATTVLEEEIAREAEEILNTQVFEIYGFSEVGAIATRRMTRGLDWLLLKDYKISNTGKENILNAPGFQKNITIPDRLDVYNDNYFRLKGRNSDLINIGGKRASLTDLTNKLKMINGVSDAIFIMPDEEKGKRVRVAALVVSDLTAKSLRRELEKYIDSVFIPRSLIIVEQLPYDESGKLSRASILNLLNKHSDKNIYKETA